MRIAHVSLRFTPPGGIVTNIRELARRLKDDGDEVEVFASEVAFLSPTDRGTDLSRSVDGIPVHRFPLWDGPWRSFRLHWLTGLARALADSRVDVIHAHNHRFAHVLEAALASARSGIPLVVTTSFHPAYATETAAKRRVIRLADYAFGATAYQVARAVVVQTDLEARLVGEFTPGDKLRKIPPGVDLAEWRDTGTDDLGDVRLPPEYFLYLGWISRKKGVEVLIEALARLPADARRPLVLVGRDVGDRPGLQELARRRGVESLMIWLEPLPRPAYRAVVRRARALVLPSAWEAFGMVLVDAMAAGTPVVATRVGGMPEVLDGGAAGLLVPYGDAGALADALRQVVDDPDATQTRVRRGSERVARLDWSVIAHEHHALYREVTGK